jgi:hypothetical protein
VNSECPQAIIAAGGEALQYFYDDVSNVEDFIKLTGV